MTFVFTHYATLLLGRRQNERKKLTCCSFSTFYL
jgi:hypothetical protein